MSQITVVFFGLFFIAIMVCIYLLAIKSVRQNVKIKSLEIKLSTIERNLSAISEDIDLFETKLNK